MSYFSLKNRTIFQIFFIVFGSFVLINVLLSVIRSGLSERVVIGLMISLGFLWTGTAPNKKKPTDENNLYEDILDSNY